MLHWPSSFSQPASDIQPSNTVVKDSTSTVATAKTGVTNEKQQDNSRKFNVVVFGVQECDAGTPRHERIQTDLNRITDIFASVVDFNPMSIRDLHRLGRFSVNNGRPRPILVKLNRTCDVFNILSKRGSFVRPISVRQDLSPQRRVTESLLFKEKRTLISGGTDAQLIKISKAKLFVDGELYGQVVNGTFVPVSRTIESIHEVIDDIQEGGHESILDANPDSRNSFLEER